MKSKYDDIINITRPRSLTHTPMPIENRAAQFAPFAALTGYESSITEAVRQTDERIILSDDELEILNRKIVCAVNNPDNIFKIIYFKDDDKKSGGEYINTKCKIKKYIEDKESILTDNKEEIKLKDIYDIDSNIIDRYSGC